MTLGGGGAPPSGGGPPSGGPPGGGGGGSGRRRRRRGGRGGRGPGGPPVEGAAQQRPPGERAPERPHTERPHTERSHTERSRDERPRGERLRDERPRGERPRDERPRGERPQRPPGERRPPDARAQDRRDDRRPPPERRPHDDRRGPPPERPAPSSPRADEPAATLRPAATLDSGWGVPDEPPAAEAAAPEVARTPTAPPPPEPRDPDGDDLFIDLTDEAVKPGTLTNIAGIKFRDAGTIHEYDAGDSSYRRGDRVMVETDRGPMPATVAVASRRMPSLDPLRRVLRLASDADERATEKSAVREREAWQFCRQRIRERRLPMKMVRVEYPLQSGKVLFYFSSEERVDFRDLVKDLAQRLHARIEMRQIGARDEAKLVGGIGSCGRELCCSTWLPAFVPVSIKMAKDQGLVLNPSKVSGQCGRLKCCLVYEQDTYKEMRKTLPKVGKRVTTPAGDGKVVELDVLRQRVRVWFDEGGSETFPANVVTLMAPIGQPPPAAREPEAEPESEADE